MPLEASVAAYWITRKVGVSIKAKEGYILYAMYVALWQRRLLATVYR